MINFFLNVKIFDDKRRISAEPRIDARKKGYRRPGGDVEIYDEKQMYRTGPRIDARNVNYQRSGGNVEV